MRIGKAGFLIKKGMWGPLKWPESRGLCLVPAP